VRGRGAKPEQLSAAYDVSRSMALIEHMKGERESRTGITRLNQGLDADTLNKTASGQASLQATGQQMEEFVARNFAESLSRLFLKKMKLMKDHAEPVPMRVDGQYKTADPSQWPDDMDVVIRVGLGSGRKEQRMAYRMQVAEMQAEAFPLGLATKKHLFNTGAGFVRDSGLGDPNDYFQDPDAPPEIDPATGQPVEKEEQPDPEMVKVQAEQQMAQVKMQAEQEATQAKLAMMREESQIKLQLQREEAEQEAQLARDKATFEAQQATQRMQQEFDLAQQRMAMEQQLAAHKASMAEQSALSKTRDGGSLAV
jgi:hypothetical protein